MSPDLWDELVADEVRDLLEDADCLDVLREYARLTDDRRGLVPTLRAALGAAYLYESMVREGTLDTIPEWVRMQEAAE